jgi:hypothetical protein
MTTTPHDEPAAAWIHAPSIPAPRNPEQPYLTFPAANRPAPQPGGVFAARVLGLATTALCALWPAFFALMLIAFGLGLGEWAGVLLGAGVALLALGWPLAFWFATTRARRVWPVLLALLPTLAAVLGTGYVLFF